MYSVWPVFVIDNNLPPWMSIKREHIMLAMIVPGLQTNGKFACPVCGPRIKSRRSRSLAKEVFDEYR
jgi:hypothetical protein